jgi:hypothetical protein
MNGGNPFVRASHRFLMAMSNETLQVVDRGDALRHRASPADRSLSGLWFSPRWVWRVLIANAGGPSYVLPPVLLDRPVMPVCWIGLMQPFGPDHGVWGRFGRWSPTEGKPRAQAGSVSDQLTRKGGVGVGAGSFCAAQLSQLNPS